jgi:hypothetical protein
MRIHPNKKAALAAIEDYRRESDALMERTGVCECCTDESADLYLRVRFFDESGKVCSYIE